MQGTDKKPPFIVEKSRAGSNKTLNSVNFAAESATMHIYMALQNLRELGVNLEKFKEDPDKVATLKKVEAFHWKLLNEIPVTVGKGDEQDAVSDMMI